MRSAFCHARRPPVVPKLHTVWAGSGGGAQPPLRIHSAETAIGTPVALRRCSGGGSWAFDLADEDLESTSALLGLFGRALTKSNFRSHIFVQMLAFRSRAKHGTDGRLRNRVALNITTRSPSRSMPHGATETRTRLAFDDNDDDDESISPLPSKLARRARHSHIHKLRVQRLQELALQSLIRDSPQQNRLNTPARERLQRCKDAPGGGTRLDALFESFDQSIRNWNLSGKHVSFAAEAQLYEVPRFDCPDSPLDPPRERSACKAELGRRSPLRPVNNAPQRPSTPCAAPMAEWVPLDGMDATRRTCEWERLFLDSPSLTSQRRRRSSSVALPTLNVGSTGVLAAQETRQRRARSNSLPELARCTPPQRYSDLWDQAHG